MSFPPELFEFHIIKQKYRKRNSDSHTDKNSTEQRELIKLRRIQSI